MLRRLELLLSTTLPGMLKKEDCRFQIADLNRARVMQISIADLESQISHRRSNCILYSMNDTRLRRRLTSPSKETIEPASRVL